MGSAGERGAGVELVNAGGIDAEDLTAAFAFDSFGDFSETGNAVPEMVMIGPDFFFFVGFDLLFAADLLDSELVDR